jgi:hypothetical protein
LQEYAVRLLAKALKRLCAQFPLKVANDIFWLYCRVTDVPLERLLACGAHESAAYQQPITTSDGKKAISLRNRLQRVRQKMAVASDRDHVWPGS